MRTSILVASLFALSLSACLDGTKIGGPGAPFRASEPDGETGGKVTGATTLDPSIHDVTVSAHDLNAKGEVVNTETYDQLDHGFALDLPAGRYEIDLTDAADHLIASYAEVVVTGDVTLGAPVMASATTAVATN